MSGFSRGVLVVVGGLIALCSIATAISAIGDAVTGASTSLTTGDAIGVAVFFAGTAPLGAFLVWQGIKRGRAPRPASPGNQASGASVHTAPPADAPADVAAMDADAERERRILQYAETEHGRVTLAEVATHCGVTVAQAKADLDRLVQQQVAELLVTEAGVLVYVFPGFLSDDEKASAHDF